MRPIVLEREFNTRYWGQSITVQAVRRWLRGEAIPSQEKLQVLADWLKIEPHVLRFGEQAVKSIRAKQKKMGRRHQLSGARGIRGVPQLARAATQDRARDNPDFRQGVSGETRQTGLRWVCVMRGYLSSSHRPLSSTSIMSMVSLLKRENSSSVSKPRD